MVRSKVKSRLHHDIAHLQSQPMPYQVSNYYLLQFQRYSLDKILKVKVNIQDQRSNQGHTKTLLTYTPSQCPYQVSTSYTLWFPRYSPGKIFRLKFIIARSKVRLSSLHDLPHIHPLIYVHIKYRVPFKYQAWTKVYYLPLTTHSSM